jgi:hypothetical protein
MAPVFTDIATTYPESVGRLRAQANKRSQEMNLRCAAFNAAVAAGEWKATGHVQGRLATPHQGVERSRKAAMELSGRFNK